MNQIQKQLLMHKIRFDSPDIVLQSHLAMIQLTQPPIEVDLKL